MTSEEMIVKIAEHDQRIEALEAADRKHVEFRKEYYQDREERIRREARLDVKLDNICADIKKAADMAGNADEQTSQEVGDGYGQNTSFGAGCGGRPYPV